MMPAGSWTLTLRAIPAAIPEQDCLLFAKRAVAASLQVEMEMVAVGFVGLRSQHGAEALAGAAVELAQERRFCTAFNFLVL